MIREAVPADTSLEAALVQYEVFRRMAPGKRLELALRMSNSLRDLVAAGARNRHPEYTDDQVRLAVIRLTLGEELFQRAYPGVDVKP